jgi:aspartyl aminopeptidase
MEQKQFNDELISFIDNSPTAFHAVSQMSSVLSAAGFMRLKESDKWDVKPGKKYFVTRNDSSIIAFSCGSGDARDTGFRMLGAHTDSPALKIKPAPLFMTNSYIQLGVEVYGGALLHPCLTGTCQWPPGDFLNSSGECASRS